MPAIGEVPWTRQEMLAELERFTEIYEQRPIRDNAGGMRAPHMFAAWFALRRLAPEAIIESGVWLGQGTWLLEQACPQAQLHCIDINLQRIRYRSDRARYYDRDFGTLDWSELPLEQTLVFFDDHQNAYERVKLARWFGFRHLIFEDNYPAACGDCYSLKKAFMHAGFQPLEEPAERSLADKIRAGLWGDSAGSGEVGRGVTPNSIDARYLRRNLAVYYEFPPVFKPAKTRWGDSWSDARYPTPEPLLERVEQSYQQVFMDEAQDYTWICYGRLRE